MSTANLFDRIVQETAKLASTPADSIPLSKGRLKRWADLATFWETQPNIFHNHFYEAIYHIAYGRYSRAAAPVRPLLSLIEDALVDDADAHSVWKKRKSFSKAFDLVSDKIGDAICHRKHWKSDCVRRYVDDKLYELLIYHNKPVPELTLKLSRDRKAFLSIRNRVENFSYCTRFEELIKLLVPDCHKWSRHQWHNEKFIFAQIKAIHGIDFTQHINDFDALVIMYQHKAEGLPYYQNLFSIHTLPVSIATAIWPDDFEKTLCKQFNIACTVKPYLAKNGEFHDKNPINPHNLINSWGVHQIISWYDSKSYPLSKATKSNLLLINLGLHPWVTRHTQNATA